MINRLNAPTSLANQKRRGILGGSRITVPALQFLSKTWPRTKQIEILTNQSRRKLKNPRRRKIKGTTLLSYSNWARKWRRASRKSSWIGIWFEIGTGRRAAGNRRSSQVKKKSWESSYGVQRFLQHFRTRERERKKKCEGESENLESFGDSNCLNRWCIYSLRLLQIFPFLFSLLFLLLLWLFILGSKVFLKWANILTDI